MATVNRQYKQTLMLFTACGLVASMAPGRVALAQSAPAQSVQVAQTGGTSSIPPNVSRGASETIVVRARRVLQKEKNSPSAVTELGAKAIAATGISGSPATLLRQAPSIYVYSQGIGDNAPELTVRGLRGLEIATTLDGVPTQDLEAPGAFYLANNLGGVFTLGQISGVSIYPGVAYPDKATFGTIGGTIAYTTKRATNDFYLDVTGSVGSFGTYKEGFELNSGALDSPLGTGDNAAKLLLNYYNLQTQGFIDGTPNRENEMEFAFDKPYDDGLSAFQTTVIYNNANGLIQNEPVPLPYLQKYGLFSNYPTNLNFAQQRNDYLTIILKDDTYINDYLKVGLTGFYIANNNQLETYGDINVFTPAGVAGPLTVGSASPFINNPAGFGEGGLFGPPVPPPLGIFGGGYGGYFYGTGHHYNPGIYYNNPKACPQSVINNFGSAGFSPCGLNDQITQQHNDTYGFQPRIEILAPEVYGIANTIKIGGLFAKETTPTGYTYYGAFPQSLGAQNLYNYISSGGTQRTIYQGYIQDKIDALDNTLHITPGLTLEGTFSSDVSGDIFRSRLSPYYASPNGYANGGTNIDRFGYYKATKWDREALPFFNVSYDFDKILPILKGLSVYGSFGNSALFAPVGDFGPSTASATNPYGAAPPYASIVHMYEGGIKYNSSNLLISADYFYQKVDRDFGFYSSQTGTNFGATVYSAVGQREFKGVEAAVVYQVTPELQLFGNFSHLLAKWLTTGLNFDTVAQDQYGVSIKGTPVSGVPDWLSTFGVDWSRNNSIFDGDKFDARVTGQYTGHQYTTCDLTLFDPSCGNVYVQGVTGVDYSGGPRSNGVFDTFTGATTTDPHGGINPFVTVNLDMNYTMPTPQLGFLKKVTFDLNIQNLFNQTYYQYFYKQVSPQVCPKSKIDPTGNPYGCAPQFSDAIPGQPFSVFFTVTARF
jgi:iron complex outermembrane receptor protein